jgi:hypothetical protein
VPDGQIAIEFCETADAIRRIPQVRRLRGRRAHRPAPRVLQPRRAGEGADLRDPNYLAEELDYLRVNPHAAPLLEVCRAAHIGWGRFDYSLLDGRIQVWEINASPLFVLPGIEDGRDEVHRLAAQGVVDAMLAVESAIRPTDICRHMALSIRRWFNLLLNAFNCRRMPFNQ